MQVHIEQQCHGYRNGHQLLGSSVRLVRGDQDFVDRLSDISGPLRPAEVFSPYITTYPLPSGSFYVIAMTWQDVNAPRAGCVLTRSLMVPMNLWPTLDSPVSLLDLLVPINREQKAISSVEFQTYHVPLARLSSSTTTELVEALFLEARTSIVVFEEPDAGLIACRLLTAFWPAIRKHFSLCTFALSPRSSVQKPFDLMFAPRHARPRFSQWEGRVIEGYLKREFSGRHRWSAVVARQIFEEESPSLQSLDTLGVLNDEDAGDESHLRLSLLWKELVEMAEGSPTAILGLIDILHSRGKTSPLELRPLIPLIVRSIAIARQTLDPSAALEFLLILSEKFTHAQILIGIADELKTSFELIAAASPHSAISFLESHNLGEVSNADLIAAGIGDGISKISDSDELLGFAARIGPEEQLRLLGCSQQWATSIIRATEQREPRIWTDTLVSALRYPDFELRARSRTTLVPLLKVSAHAILLDALLRDTDNQVVLSVAQQLRDVNQFSVPEFDEPLLRAAHGVEGLLALRQVALDGLGGADRFLIKTIRLESNDFEWLTRKIGSPRRRALLLNAVLASTSDSELQAALRDDRLNDQVEALLGEDLDVTASQLARVLVMANAPAERLLRVSSRLLPLLQDRYLRSALLTRSLSVGLSTASVGDDLAIAKLLSQCAGLLDSHRLVALAIPRSATWQRITANVVILDTSTSSIREGVLGEIEELTDRLLAKPLHGLSTELIASWARLLADSSRVNSYAQLSAAGKILSFALGAPAEPVSPLVVVAFPVVYARLKSGDESPNLFSFVFTDWDKCKTARSDIVDAFVRSHWPATDLIRAVEPTGDLPKTLAKLFRHHHAEAFLDRLKIALNELPASERTHFQSVIAEVLERRSDER